MHDVKEEASGTVAASAWDLDADGVSARVRRARWPDPDPVDDWKERPARGSGRLGGRVFGHGGLRLALLQLIAAKPSHGYELIKAIAEQLQGRYTPSPGVLYPTLAWLEDLGLIEPAEDADAGRAGRRPYRATPRGRAYLEANQAAVAALSERIAALSEQSHERPPQVERAVSNLKMAVHMRLARGPLTEQQIRAFARVLDAAAQDIESL